MNDESAVGPVADALGEALTNQNIRVIPCHDGQVRGRDNAVRVFNVQHIKGLEFEAVFFVGIDRLARSHPELFGNYLYVGATRAATYLGLTCEQELPDSMMELRDGFGERWEQIVPGPVPIRMKAGTMAIARASTSPPGASRRSGPAHIHAKYESACK